MGGKVSCGRKNATTEYYSIVSWVENVLPLQAKSGWRKEEEEEKEIKAEKSRRKEDEEGDGGEGGDWKG